MFKHGVINKFEDLFKVNNDSDNEDSNNED